MAKRRQTDTLETEKRPKGSQAHRFRQLWKKANRRRERNKKGGGQAVQLTCLTDRQERQEDNAGDLHFPKENRKSQGIHLVGYRPFLENHSPEPFDSNASCNPRSVSLRALSSKPDSGARPTPAVRFMDCARRDSPSAGPLRKC